MIKEKKTLKGKIPSRRKFFKAAAATGAAATAAVAMPNIAFGAPQTLKMQAAWPSGANIFFEMAGDYCKMVSDMSGGSLRNIAPSIADNIGAVAIITSVFATFVFWIETTKAILVTEKVKT